MAPECTPPNTCILGPIWAQSSNAIWISSAVFVQFTAECPYTLQWATLLPQNYPFPWGNLGPHLTHGSLDSPKYLPKWHLDRFNHFCYCHRPTEHATQSVTIGHIYVCSTAMQPKNGSRDLTAHLALVCHPQANTYFGLPLKAVTSSVPKLWRKCQNLKSGGNLWWLDMLSHWQYHCSIEWVWFAIRLSLLQKLCICFESFPRYCELFVESRKFLLAHMYWCTRWCFDPVLISPRSLESKNESL